MRDNKQGLKMTVIEEGTAEAGTLNAWSKRAPGRRPLGREVQNPANYVELNCRVDLSTN